MNISEFSLQAAIDGLVSSFTWSQTGEGYSYWNDTYYELVHLTDPAMQRSDGVASPRGVDQKGCLETAAALSGAFTWDQTPQGHLYWGERYHKLLVYAGVEEKEPQESYEDAYNRAMGILG